MTEQVRKQVMFSRRIKPEYREKLLKYLPIVLEYFPELEGKVIKVGLTTTAYGRFIHNYSNEKFIYIQVDPRLDPPKLLHTLAHELTHYIQDYYNVLKDEAMKYERLRLLYLKKIPHGEKACDIYTYARSPLFVARSPYLNIKVDLDKISDKERLKVYKIARYVIKMRNLANYKNYIKLFEDTVNARLRSCLEEYD